MTVLGELLERARSFDDDDLRSAKAHLDEAHKNAMLIANAAEAQAVVLRKLVQAVEEFTISAHFPPEHLRREHAVRDLGHALFDAKKALE